MYRKIKQENKCRSKQGKIKEKKGRFRKYKKKIERVYRTDRIMKQSFWLRYNISSHFPFQGKRISLGELPSF